jgi:hypothetical protein
MSAITADITTSPNEDHTEIIFTANTPKGDEWMGEHTITKPIEDALGYRDAAINAGLSVIAFL